MESRIDRSFAEFLSQRIHVCIHDSSLKYYTQHTTDIAYNLTYLIGSRVRGLALLRVAKHPLVRALELLHQLRNSTQVREKEEEEEI